MNCWEFKKCERLPGKSEVSEFGVCPAYTIGIGNACWLVPYTLCEGQIQHDIANKKAQYCYNCSYYMKLSIDRKLLMEEKYGSLKEGKSIVEVLQQVNKANAGSRNNGTNDVLTGLLNRNAIKDVLVSELERSKRDEKSLSIILLDIGDLKNVFLSQGQSAREQLICEVTKEIRSRLRIYDLLGKYDENKYIVISPGCNKDKAMKVANRLKDAIQSKSISGKDGIVPLSVNIGVCAIEKVVSKNTDFLFQIAEESLYRANRNGRVDVISV